MLIGVSGTLSAGKTEVARYLKYQGFRHISVGGADGTPDVLCQSQQELLDYVTRNWREKFVMTHLEDHNFLDILLKRPFFLHVSVDAPLLQRFDRYRKKYSKEIPLEEFAAISDQKMYGKKTSLVKIMGLASIKIINHTGNVEQLYVQLSNLNLLDNTRLRPDWDCYFMRLADLAALRSNCMKRRVGCVIVRDKRVVATGYNGTPRKLANCNAGGCARCNSGEGLGSGLHTCLCLHAEENALLEAGRDRVGAKAILYCNTCPCLTCSIKIVQAGVSKVVYSQSYSMDALSANVFKEAGVILRQYIPPKEGIVDV